MKLKKVWITTILASLTGVGLFGMNVNSSFSQTLGETENETEEEVTFFCRDVYDAASEEQLPTTVAWVPEQEGHVFIVVWKSRAFELAGWTPEARCEAVSPKFQKAYEEGRLSYLTNGASGGYPIICAVSELGEQCNGDNQLFTLKSFSSAERTLLRLNGILKGEGGTPVYQSSGGQVYVPMNEFLQYAPTMEDAES